MTPLRQRMIEDMNLRNLAPPTVKVYEERVAKFAQPSPGRGHSQIPDASRPGSGLRGRAMMGRAV
jgi:hypothetical protein